MRLVDEIFDRPPALPLPAPSGPRVPTGSVPIIKALSPTPPADSAMPVGPYLPPVAAKVTAPTTTSEGTTALAMAALQLQTAAATAAPAPAKKRHMGLIVLGIVVALPLMLAVVFRNNAFVERFTGKGYDTNPLPTQAFPEPTFAGAEYTLTTQSVAMSEGLPTNFWRTERDQVNFTSKIAKASIDRAKASVIGGEIGTPQSMSPPTEVYIDAQMTYFPGAAQTDPWTRQSHDAGASAVAVLSPREVLMYQDVVDPALRSQHPASVVSETRHDIAVTTYTYTIAFGKFYDSAPRLFELARMVDGNAGSDAKVTVTISLDQQWMVRYLDINVDFHAVLKYKAERDTETSFPYRYTIDVVSTSDQPPAISIPSNVVDAAPTTLPAPTAAP